MCDDADAVANDGCNECSLEFCDRQTPFVSMADRRSTKENNEALSNSIFNGFKVGVMYNADSSVQRAKVIPYLNPQPLEEHAFNAQVKLARGGEGMKLCSWGRSGHAGNDLTALIDRCLGKKIGLHRRLEQWARRATRH
jgi:hypothetical protein